MIQSRKRKLGHGYYAPSPAAHKPFRRPYNNILAIKRNKNVNKTISVSKSINITRPIINWHPTFMPMLFQTKLSYTNTVVYTVPAAGYYGLTFKGNSPLNVMSGGTTDAIGLLELTALYTKMRVLGSRITVSLTHSAGGSKRFYLFPKTSGALLTDAQIIANTQPAVSTVVSEYDPTKTVNEYTRASTMYGFANVYDKDFTMTTGGDPASFFYWHTYLVGAENDALTAKVTVEYYCQFWDNKYPDPDN